MSKSKDKLTVGIIMSACVAAVIVLMCVGIGSAVQKVSIGEDKSLDELLEHVQYDIATPTKASINLSDASLYDEMPEIEKYPFAVEGRGNVDIEIFTSGEKAGQGNDAWLIDCAEDFNRQNIATSSGKTVSMSIRSVSSGLAADYIISQKYLPDLYTPSNTLFAEYAAVNGGKLEVYNDRLVGNTAGILIRKGSEYKDTNSIISAVMDGKLNIGYTNPQTSATGLNLLLNILYTNGGVEAEAAAAAFTKFNNNIPFVSYTTQQMAASASNGSLDGMVTEYQAYINNQNLKSSYDFIPFGMRHDNPLYIVNKAAKSDDELEAIKIINDYLISDKAQKIAAGYGFNANDDYKDPYSAAGSEITRALKIYKTEKDAGKDIIAIFVADCSGSMSGVPITELKESLSNGIQYINENNYIGLVSYSNNVTVEVPVAPFDLNQKSYFQGGINKLSANGGTSSYEAVCVAMKLIEDAKVDHPDAKCMIFLLTDGYANGRLSIGNIRNAVLSSSIPVYTIGYTDNADMNALQELSGINEAASISADSGDIVYQIKSLFNAQL